MKKILILSFVLSLVLAGCSLGKEKQVVLTLEEAKTKTADFINKNLMQPGSTVSIKEITEEEGLYKVIVNLSDGQEITSFITKDGKKFFPQVMDIAEIESKNTPDDSADTDAQANSSVPKSEKPVVELFVMSFCPYGVQAENAMKPVVDLLGDKVDINIRFIASVSGDSLDDVKSLHGAVEGKEDARQLCIAKNNDKSKLWNYVMEINKNCYPIYRNGEDVYEKCWKDAAKTAKVDIAQIESCYNDEGVGLINGDDAIAKGYGVSGSPTLIINGVKSNSGRTPEAYKQTICDAFENAPEECGQELSTAGGDVEGGCN